MANVINITDHIKDNHDEQLITKIKLCRIRDEIEEKLAKLQSDPDASQQEIHQAEEDLKTIDYLYENFNLGMNVFRTAKGGRDKHAK